MSSNNYRDFFSVIITVLPLIGVSFQDPLTDVIIKGMDDTNIITAVENVHITPNRS